MLAEAHPRLPTPQTLDCSEIQWITPADLSGYKEKYIARGSRSITDKGLKSSSAQLLPTNTLLFSSRAPIGYVVIASQPVTTNQGFKSLVLSEEIDPSFIYYYLLRAKETIQSLGGGTTFRKLRKFLAPTLPRSRWH